MLSMKYSLSAKKIFALLAFGIVSGTAMRRACELKNPTIACLARALWELTTEHHIVRRRAVSDQPDQHGTVLVAQSLLEGAASR